MFYRISNYIFIVNYYQTLDVYLISYFNKTDYKEVGLKQRFVSSIKYYNEHFSFDIL